jgi:hypothetical protein
VRRIGIVTLFFGVLLVLLVLLVFGVFERHPPGDVVVDVEQHDQLQRVLSAGVQRWRAAGPLPARR